MTVLVELKDINYQRSKQFGLRVNHLAVVENQILALIGPNGAGKSTLLLVLAGLIQPQSGQMSWRGQSLNGDNLSYRRRIGLVLQDPLLLDTSVYENVALGLNFRGILQSEVSRRVNDALEQMGIAHLRLRRAHSLSGGEAQRVSLARALALQPDLLLLDEPFSALDAPTRIRLQEDFHALVTRTSITTVMVTHDMDEALLLADRVAVMLNGSTRQVGTPQEIFNSPLDADVAALVGVETIIPGRALTCEAGLVIIQVGGQQLEAVGQVRPGQEVFLCLRPEDVTLYPGETPILSSARNRLHGRVEKMLPQGPLVRVTLDCGFPLISLITRTSAQQLELQDGKEVAASFKATAVHLIPR